MASDEEYKKQFEEPVGYTAELLSPLFYRTHQDGGAAGTTVTGEWLGDLALCHGIHRVLGLDLLPDLSNSHQPDYESLALLPFTTSVAVPEGRTPRTRIYNEATSFLSDGRPHMEIIRKRQAEHSMKMWRRRQGLAAGGRFTFALLPREGWRPFQRLVIRAGTMLETPILLWRKRAPPETITANLLTLTAIHGRQIPEGLDYLALESPVHPYRLAHGVPVEQWAGVLRGVKLEGS